VNFTGTSRVLHRHRPRSSPVNFTEFPRVHVPVNTKNKEENHHDSKSDLRDDEGVRVRALLDHQNGKRQNCADIEQENKTLDHHSAISTGLKYFSRMGSCRVGALVTESDIECLVSLVNHNRTFCHGP
jgi:hypothetical protein